MAPQTRGGWLEPGGALKGRLFAALVRPPAADAPLAAGTVVGRYRITGELGRGGCGIVYGAERCDGVFAHTVALKLGRPRRRDLVVRERESLARLEHPGIARIIDGGETGDGHSWLAMELVDGEPIDRWCARARASWRRRVALMIEICAIVQYAHNRLVVHRDLKPANIFVDASGKPRLLDFGVSLLVDAGGDTTAVGASPGYSSPEQRAGQPTDAATDVYSLGVMVDELLASCPGAPRLARDNLAAVIRRATAADRGLRYESAALLAADLQRVAEGRPAQARRWALSVRAGFFLRRRWLPLAVTTLVASVLLAMAVVSTQRITRERDQVRREEQTTREVSAFLIELFEGARADEGDGSTVLRMLERGRRLAEQDRDAAPATTSALLHALGGAYYRLGRLADAEALVARAVAIRRQSGDAARLRLAESLTELSRLRFFRGSPSDSFAHANEARALLADDGDAAPRQRYDALLGLADAYERTGRYAEAGPVLDEAMSMALRVSGEHGGEHVRAVRVHAHWLADRQQEAAALPEAEYVVARMTAAAGRDDPAVVYEQIFLASLWAGTGRARDAERYFRELYARNGSIAGDVAWRRHAARYYLGFALEYQGRYAEAAEAFRAALDDVAAVEGREAGPHWAADAIDVADLYRRQGEPVEAEALLRRAIAVAAETLPDDGPVVVRAQMLLAQLRLQQGRLDEAEALVRRAAAGATRIFGDTSYATARAQAVLGELRRQRGDVRGAREAFAATRRMTASGSVFERAELAASVAWSEAQVAAASGDVDAALRIQAAGVEAAVALVGSDHRLTVIARLRLAVLRDLA